MRLRLLLILAALVGCVHRPASPETEAHRLPAGDNIVGSIHVGLGIPLDPDPLDDYFIDRRFLVASYNPKRRVVNWVAWRVVAADLGSVHRRDNFRPDGLLPLGFYRVRSIEYERTGFDRGHLCPSADRTSSREANDSTFLMTNVQPQLPSMNRGPWAELESYTRRLVRRGKQVYVVAGGTVSLLGTSRSSLSWSRSSRSRTSRCTPPSTRS